MRASLRWQGNRCGITERVSDPQYTLRKVFGRCIAVDLGNGKTAAPKRMQRYGMRIGSRIPDKRPELAERQVSVIVVVFHVLFVETGSIGIRGHHGLLERLPMARSHYLLLAETIYRFGHDNAMRRGCGTSSEKRKKTNK